MSDQIESRAGRLLSQLSFRDRLSEATGVLVRARTKDGRWRAQNRHTGDEFFRLEEAREPSQMNTLRALRVLRWVGRRRSE